MNQQELSHSCQCRELEQKVLRFIKEGVGNFESLALEIHFWQRQNCPAYAAFCAGHPEPSGWQEVPAVPLTAFRQAALRTFPEHETAVTFRTSGTTGEGFGEHHFRTLDLYQAAVLTGWEQAGLPRQRIVCLLPSTEEAPHSSLSCMAGWLASPGSFYLGKWDALHRDLERAEEAIVLFGTALAFLDFFEYLDSGALPLPPGSLAVETGGYKGSRRDIPKGELYQRFQRHLGLDADAVWNEYGMTELSSQFYTHGLGRPHRTPPWVRTLVINPETERPVAEGETGLLRIFDLANVGSCSAIQTRDLAIRRSGDFELIGRDPSALPRGCSRAADELLT